MTRTQKRKFSKAAAGAALTIGSLHAWHAQAQTWTATTDGNWSTAANWNNGAGPAPVSGSTTALVFFAADPTTYAAAYTGTGAFSFNSITLNNNSANAITISNVGTLTPAGASPSVIQNGSGAVNFFNGVATNNLLFSLPAAGLTFRGTGSGTITLGAQANAGSVFTGSGPVTFNLPNAKVILGNMGVATGALTIVSGTVTAGGDTGGDLLDNATLVTVSNGATFDFAGNGEQMGGIAGAGTILIDNIGMTLNLASNQTWSGSINGLGGNFSKQTASVYTFTGTNGYSGNTTVGGGALNLVDNGALLNTAAITVSLGGTLSLSNTGTANVADRLNDAARATLNGGSLVLTGSAAAASSETIAGVTIGAGPAVIAVNPGAGQTAVLILGNASGTSIARTAAGGYVNFTGAGDVFAPGTVPASGAIIGGYALVGTNWATVAGGKIAPLSTYQTSNSPASWSAADDVLVTGPLAQPPAADQTVNSLNVAAAGTIDLGNTALSLSSGGLLASASGTIINGTVRTALPSGSGKDLIVTVAGNANLTVSAVIADGTTAANPLTKGGSGTLTLLANNTYTGNTFVNEGTLAIASDASLGAVNRTLTFNGGNLKLVGNASMPSTRAVTVNAASFTFDTNGFNGTVAGAITGAGGLVKAGAGTLALTNTANKFTGGIRITGGTLESPANGTATLSSGNISLEGVSTLRLVSGTSVTPTVSIAAGGTGTVDVGANTVTFGKAFTGSGNLVKVGSGTLVGLVGPLTGNFFLQEGTYRSTTGDAIGSSTTLVTSAGTLFDESFGDGETFGGLSGAGNAYMANQGFQVGANNQSTTFSGQIFNALSGTVGAGTGVLTKQGSGTFTLSGNNPYTGGTVISAGTLLANNTTGSATGLGPVTVNGGTLGGNGTVAGSVTVNNGGKLAPGGSAVARLTLGGGTNALATGSTFEVQLADVGNDGTVLPGVDFDQLLLTGTGATTLGTNAKLSVLLVGAVTEGQQFNVLHEANGGTVTGLFYTTAGVPLNENDLLTAGAQTFRINYTAADVTLTAVPEPAATSLVAAAALSSLAARRRRRPLRTR